MILRYDSDNHGECLTASINTCTQKTNFASWLVHEVPPDKTWGNGNDPAELTTYPEVDNVFNIAGSLGLIGGPTVPGESGTLTWSPINLHYSAPDPMNPTYLTRIPDNDLTAFQATGAAVADVTTITENTQIYQTFNGDDNERDLFMGMDLVWVSTYHSLHCVRKICSYQPFRKYLY